MALVSLSSRPIGGAADRPPGACFFSPIKGADNCTGGRALPPPVIPTLYTADYSILTARLIGLIPLTILFKQLARS